jgi:hypothetical protein
MLLKKMGLTGALYVGLSGCQMALPDLGSAAKDAPTSVRLFSSAFTITAPNGFCIDTASMKDAPDSGFVLMADCAPLRGKKSTDDLSKSAVLTVAISAPLESADSVTPTAMERFFETPQGQTTLSRSGDPSSVSVDFSSLSDDVLMLHTFDSSPAIMNGLDGDDWRAFTVIKGRLVTLTAARFSGAPKPNPSAKALVTALVRRVQVENATE